MLPPASETDEPGATLRDNPMTPRYRIALVLAALLPVAAAACSSDGGSLGGDGAAAAATSIAAATTSAAGAATTTTDDPATRYYLSLGDSYASGYEAGKGNTTNGFAYQVVTQAKAAGFPLKLINVGCAGATTASLLESPGCPAVALGPGAGPYDDQTQIEAAEAFLRAHPGQVDLITVSIGGNDVTKCGDSADAVACVTDAVGSIKQNVPTIVSRLRAAAGPATLIVGTTYPDVILGSWVEGTAEGQQLATLSVTAFQQLINPALQAAYASGAGQFVDVTEATGAYGPLTDMTDLAPYGSIPIPVAKVCELTYFCAEHDIHPNADGYSVIAGLVTQAFVAAQQAG